MKSRLGRLHSFQLLKLNCNLILVCEASRKETIERPPLSLQMKNLVEEIEMSSRTTSYIEGIGDNEESVVDDNKEAEVDGVEDDTPSFEYNNDNSIDDNIKNSQKFTNELRQRKKSKEHSEPHQHSFKVDEKSDKLCCWLLIFTSCFSSFAHGSNDVANAIGPLLAPGIYMNNSVEKKADVPLWILALGGAGIVFGLATWGYKIINRLGRDLTKSSPSRGFLIELSAATYNYYC